MKPLLSVNKNEARLRVLSLYKAWYRQIPFILTEYDLPVTRAECVHTLRERFQTNKHVTDVRVIDMLVVKV